MDIQPKRASSLLPDRHPQQELFVCDVADAVLKDDMASMEHPIFTLSKKPDTTERRYEHNGKWLVVTPSVRGLATIYDKDILIYAISQLMAAKKEERPLSRRIIFSARDFLMFANRHTGGRDYDLLEDALIRLRGTTLSTNITTDGAAPTKVFGLVSEATLHRNPETRRVTRVEVELSDWLFRAIHADEVLTLHSSYFRLGRPTDRRIYEIARKHCGAQREWKVGLVSLHRKCGSGSPLRRFRYIVSEISETDYLPDYSVSLVENDMVLFTNRNLKDGLCLGRAEIFLDAETYNDARACAPGWDVYVLEERWRAWMADGGLDAPRNPDKAFLGFCRKWFERRGAPG